MIHMTFAIVVCSIFNIVIYLSVRSPGTGSPREADRDCQLVEERPKTAVVTRSRAATDCASSTVQIRAKTRVSGSTRNARPKTKGVTAYGPMEGNAE